MNQSTQTVLRSWANKTIDLFLPPVCAACGSVGQLICPACRSQFIWLPPRICPACGEALDEATEPHQSCLTAVLLLQQVFAPLHYERPLATIIHKLKYDGYFALARPLAQILVETWPSWENSPDLIMPIPLHARRLKERGFNQSALLARYLAVETRLSVDEHALQRIRHTMPQVGLNPDERHHNVSGAFAADSARIRDRHIILVDDVFTTGATMRAAASSLIDSGAATVSAYCLARTAG